MLRRSDHETGAIRPPGDVLRAAVAASHGGDGWRHVTADYRDLVVAANLYVCDASVFPTSVGVNPIESIMALADYAAPRILSRC
jgi:choline dehydrogenase-like flavoprotein